MDAEPPAVAPDAPRDLRAPLDPYVERLVRWVAARPEGAPAVGLAAAVARDCDWPLPFAEAVLTSVRARRLLRVHRTGARALRLTPSPRAQRWLLEQSTRMERGTTE